MFDKPKSTSYVAPATPIDVNQRYFVRLTELTDLGPSKFPQPGDDPNNPTHRIQWKFQIASMDGQKVLDLDGNPYEHYDYTSSKTGKPRGGGNGKTATARLWMEALFGHPLEDDEIGPDIATELRGKTAVALFENKESGGQDGTEKRTRLSILRLSPRPAAQQTAAPVPRQSTITKISAALGVDPSEIEEFAPHVKPAAATSVATAPPKDELPW